MEDFGAGQPFEMQASGHGSHAMSDPSEFFQADDPLGDEAAFPLTWQQLAVGEPPRD